MARKTIEMVNIYPGAVTVQIDGMAGTEGLEYTVEEGGSLPFDENLCNPVPGAGLNKLPSIMSRLSMRTWPDTTFAAPALVPKSEVKAAKADVERKLKNAKNLEAKKAVAKAAVAAVEG